MSLQVAFKQFCSRRIMLVPMSTGINSLPALPRSFFNAPNCFQDCIIVPTVLQCDVLPYDRRKNWQFSEVMKLCSRRGKWLARRNWCALVDTPRDQIVWSGSRAHQNLLGEWLITCTSLPLTRCLTWSACWYVSTTRRTSRGPDASHRLCRCAYRHCLAFLERGKQRATRMQPTASLCSMVHTCN